MPIETTLKDLARVGTLVKDRGYRQIWRFEHDAKPYYLKFYPRQGSSLKRFIRGSPAVREFYRLQHLQRADIPAPRAVAMLSGFKINGQSGDAVILEGIEPSVQLDQYLNDLKLNATPVPDHLSLSRQVRTIVHQLARANLGHSDLHLGNFLLHQNKLFLLDGYAVRTGGLKRNDVLLLGHSVSRFATRTDLQRGWEQLTTGGRMPKQNPVSNPQWRKFMGRTTGENRYFGRLDINGWAGVYYKHTKFPRRWGPASRLNVEAKDWERAFPLLLEQIESGQLTPLKESRSGDVLAGEVVLGGRPVAVVVKRPYKRYWYRYINEIGRGSRARRAWGKAWNLVARNIPTAWPLLMMEKRSFGYVTESIIVFERVPGKTLADVDLDAIAPPRRDMLFRRTGGILRQIEQFGFAHFDAKASNWIVQEDEKLGPRPILIDVDGIRYRRWTTLGIRRLLRSMPEHPQYTREDSLALCQGYAPFSPLLVREEDDEDDRESEISDLKSEIPNHPHPNPLRLDRTRRDPEYRERG